MKSLRLFLIAGMLFSWMAASHAGVAGGVINFSGSIVEGPCTVNVVNSTASTECYRNGQNYRATQTLANIDVGSKELPMNLGTSQVKWINQQKKLAIMTVEYR
ncbi:type 1 fimbrial protein [Serratia sp. L9]|uniref:type 1 fimbrial protein n=1 Tax=Serratia sp. L9 TaxID=3423946 RepID=UPI003D666F96